jgi:hypothetical protein
VKSCENFPENAKLSGQPEGMEMSGEALGEGGEPPGSNTSIAPSEREYEHIIETMIVAGLVRRDREAAVRAGRIGSI